jgi:dTDP-4-amino-4,6-dideoxygalactose transaminase
MDVWQNLCHEAGLILIEDCAQAHLATWQGAKAGGFGLAGAYSFYPTKNLGALGDAGMLVTDDAELAKRAMCLRNYGQSQRYHHPELGLNSRLDELQAALLSERLKWLPEFTETRRKVAASYQAEITNPKVRLLAKPQETDAHVYHLFVLNTDHRDALIDHLKINGVQSLIHYPISIHQQPPCLDIGRDPNGLTHSEHHANTCLSLPCHPQLSEIDVAKIVNAVNSF